MDIEEWAREFAIDHRLWFLNTHKTAVLGPRGKALLKELYEIEKTHNERYNK